MAHCCYLVALDPVSSNIPFYLEGINYTTSSEPNLELFLERLQKKSQALLLLFKFKYYVFTEVVCLNIFNLYSSLEVQAA